MDTSPCVLRQVLFAGCNLQYMNTPAPACSPVSCNSEKILFISSFFKSLTMLIFLLALASTAISIAVGARIPISARQSQRWNDEFVAEPIDFKATQISGCR